MSLLIQIFKGTQSFKHLWCIFIMGFLVKLFVDIEDRFLCDDSNKRIVRGFRITRIMKIKIKSAEA